MALTVSRQMLAAMGRQRGSQRIRVTRLAKMEDRIEAAKEKLRWHYEHGRVLAAELVELQKEFDKVLRTGDDVSGPRHL